MKEKTFCIKTLGCKVNQYESQVIRENFLKSGYSEVEHYSEADIYVVNTCTVTAASDSKSLKSIRKALKDNKCVIATGCMVEDKDLRFTGVRYVIKNKDKHRIAEIIDKGSRIARNKEHKVRISGFKGHTRGFVKVQDGCDNMCSYCKVRVVRGRSKSRPFKEIIDESARLIENGTKEIVLTGICLGAYGMDLRHGVNLCSLIRELCKIKGNWRLRLSSIEPKDVTQDLISLIQSNLRICRHLHIPFQSGDSVILRMMNRPYAREDYLDLVNRLKIAVPDIAISTDIMVGFPGETEERFQNTVNFIKDVEPVRVHIFLFSKRKGTEACDYKDNVRPFTKKLRRVRLATVAAESSMNFIRRFIGKEIEVLVEERKGKDGYLQGYTDRYIKVYMDGPDRLKSTFVKCRLTLTNSRPYGILASYPY